MAADRKINIVVAVKDQTKKGLGKVNTGIKRFAAGAKRSMAIVGKAMKAAFKVAAAAIAAILAKLLLDVRRQFAEIDDLAKDAMRFGIAIENMRGLQLAAKLSGNSLATMSTIMRDLGRRTSEAAQGQGESVAAIKELGLEAKDLNRLSPEAQLDRVLKALRSVENHNDRIRLAYDIMGRSGTQALTLLNTSLHSVRLESELLTGTLTADMAFAIQDANDEVARMQAAWSGIAQTIAVQIAPAIKGIAGFIKNELILVRQLFDNAGEIFFVSLKAKSLEFVKFLSDQIGTFIRDTVSAINLALTLAGFDSNLPGLGGEFLKQFSETLQDEINDLNDKLNEMTRLPGNLGDESGGGDGSGGGGLFRRTKLPGITEGRLITGAASAGRDRIMAVWQQRRQEAKQQSDDQVEAQEKTAEAIREMMREYLGIQPQFGQTLAR